MRFLGWLLIDSQIHIDRSKTVECYFKKPAMTGIAALRAVSPEGYLSDAGSIEFMFALDIALHPIVPLLDFMVHMYAWR